MISSLIIVVCIFFMGLLIRALQKLAMRHRTKKLVWVSYLACLAFTAAIYFVVQAELVPRTTTNVLLVYVVVGYFALYEGYKNMKLL
jgi:hypothetical protein